MKCRYCGEFLDGRPRASGAINLQIPTAFLGYEYKSKTTLLGLPLIHIAQGINPATGRPRVAKGIIAIGNVAIGVIALGGVALGGLTFGGCSIGVLALGGLALGGVAMGGAAIAIYFAVGGLAVAGKIAIGGLAIAPHVIGSGGADPEAVRQLKEWFPALPKILPQVER